MSTYHTQTDASPAVVALIMLQICFAPRGRVRHLHMQKGSLCRNLVLLFAFLILCTSLETDSVNALQNEQEEEEEAGQWEIFDRIEELRSEMDSMTSNLVPDWPVLKASLPSGEIKDFPEGSVHDDGEYPDFDFDCQVTGDECFGVDIGCAMSVSAILILLKDDQTFAPLCCWLRKEPLLCVSVPLLSLPPPLS